MVKCGDTLESELPLGGRVLAGWFAGQGHEVAIGTRDPRSDKARDLQAALDGACGSSALRSGSFR